MRTLLGVPVLLVIATVVALLGCQRREVTMAPRATATANTVEVAGRVEWEQPSRSQYFLTVNCGSGTALCKSPDSERLFTCPRCLGGIVAFRETQLLPVGGFIADVTGPGAVRLDERCAVWSVVVDARGAEVQRRQLEKAPAECDEVAHLKGRINLSP